MKKEKLIEELQKLPDGIEICILDSRKNIFNCSGDEDDPGNVMGIDPDFKVEFYKRPIVKKEFAGLVFQNDDYTEDCEPNLGSLIAAVIMEDMKQ